MTNDSHTDPAGAPKSDWFDPKWVALIWICPGAAALIAYAMNYGLFPQLLTNTSVLGLGLMTAVVLFSMAVGVLYGTLSWTWLIVLAGFLRSKHGKTIAIAKFDRRMLFALSVLIFLGFGVVALQVTAERDWENLKVLGYFWLSGLMIASVLNPVIHDLQLTRRLFPIALGVPLVILPIFPWAREPLLNQTMRLMGFRTGRGELVFVSPSAYQTMSDKLALYGRKPDACAMSVGTRQMWWLRQGVVVWQGLIPQVDVSDMPNGDLGTTVASKDVLVVPKTGARHCR